VIVVDTSALVAMVFNEPERPQTELAIRSSDRALVSVPTALEAQLVVYGKGSGHSASLNFGDLFSYALAKVRGLPLLFKGDGFGHTDVQRVV
jgi:ribonuclease VapC